MGEFSIWHWLVVLLVVMLLFGSGKVSGLMGDLAKGIKSFKATMAEDDPPKVRSVAPPVAAPAPGTLEAEQAAERPPATPVRAPVEAAAPVQSETNRAA
jgi:sec-independent protein translocase protein TatA